MSKNRLTNADIPWQETPKGLLYEDANMGVTLEIAEDSSGDYAVYVNGDHGYEYFASMDAAKTHAENLGLVALVASRYMLCENLPDFGVYMRTIGLRDGDSALLAEMWIGNLRWMSRILFQASSVFQLEGKLLKADLYFGVQGDSEVLAELEQHCDGPDLELAELWFPQRIEIFHLRRPIRIFSVLARLSAPEGRPVGPLYEPFEVVGFSTTEPDWSKWPE